MTLSLASVPVAEETTAVEDGGSHSGIHTTLGATPDVSLSLGRGPTLTVDRYRQLCDLIDDLTASIR